jgi:hypothetical protein
MLRASKFLRSSKYATAHLHVNNNMYRYALLRVCERMPDIGLGVLPNGLAGAHYLVHMLDSLAAYRSDAQGHQRTFARYRLAWNANPNGFFAFN